MPIIIEDTNIPEVKIIRGNRFHDERGFFTETYKENEYLEAGLPKFVQDNMSKSVKGVIRGLHWQIMPFEQGKLVSCVKGSIYDVAVDIRVGSKNYGQSIAVELSFENGASLWVPPGFAHGFQSLEEDTLVSYKVTTYWNKDSERSAHPFSPTFNISWPLKEFILSKKDSESEKL